MEGLPILSLMLLVPLVGAVLWIDTLSGEVVALLQSLGFMFDVPAPLLGQTALAWGNSVGDAFANAALARQLAAEAVLAMVAADFAGAARRLTLSTVGFLMYLNPTLQFLLALWVFDETLSWPQLITFVLIWIGLGF